MGFKGSADAFKAGGFNSQLCLSVVLPSSADDISASFKSTPGSLVDVSKVSVESVAG